MAKSLGLRLGRRRSTEGGSSFGWGAGTREQMHLLRYGAAEVVKGFADVGRVVVCFVVV